MIVSDRIVLKVCKDMLPLTNKVLPLNVMLVLELTEQIKHYGNGVVW